MLNEYDHDSSGLSDKEAVQIAVEAIDGTLDIDPTNVQIYRTNGITTVYFKAKRPPIQDDEIIFDGEPGHVLIDEAIKKVIEVLAGP
jgi:hypothetical protein